MTGLQERPPRPHAHHWPGSTFDHFARRMANYAGRPVVFFTAFLGVLIWALTGPFLGFSDLWQLSINTLTTIITFLMVFLIQNSQNRDTAAIQIKLDELIWATQRAHNHLLGLEEMSQEELEEFRARYVKLGQEMTGLSEADTLRSEEWPGKASPTGETKTGSSG